MSKIIRETKIEITLQMREHTGFKAIVKYNNEKYIFLHQDFLTKEIENTVYKFLRGVL